MGPPDLAAGCSRDVHRRYQREPRLLDTAAQAKGQEAALGLVGRTEPSRLKAQSARSPHDSGRFFFGSGGALRTPSRCSQVTGIESRQ
jgi:hypothetical protein